MYSYLNININEYLKKHYFFEIKSQIDFNQEYRFRIRAHLPVPHRVNPWH